jgi:stage II sporulation protein D
VGFSRGLSFAKYLLFFAAPLGAQAAPSLPGNETAAKEIRVLIGTYSRATISGFDLLVNGGDRLRGEGHFNVRCGQAKGAPFIDYGAGRMQRGRIEISAPGGFLRVNGKLYRSRLSILAKGNSCAVINTLDLEKYLAGLINKEMVPSWPLEALKAQAVASRTYALYQARENRRRDYDLESTTQDQVYDGASSETPRSSRAVAETRNQVLAFGDRPIKAYFHANCGGMTEVPEFVWGGGHQGQFRTVACPYHQREKYRRRWSVQVNRAQLESALRKVAGLIPRGFLRIAHLEAGAPNASQRLSDVLISDASGNNLIISANTFRNAVGNTKVKSTAFTIRKAADGYRIEGEGAGHGVGMCQVGARGMADEGKGYRQILRYYYPLAKIRTL